ELERMVAARTRVGEQLKKLEETVVSAEGKQRLAALTAARAAYIAHQQQAAELAKAQQTAEAVALLMGPMRESQRAFLNAIEALIEFQAGLMERSAQAAAASYQTARSLMLAIGAAALLL